MLAESLGWCALFFVLVGLYSTAGLGKLASIRWIIDNEFKTGAGSFALMEQVKSLKQISRILFWIAMFSLCGVIATGIAYLNIGAV